ncbi:hypothetical protein CHLRE_16g664000v5 [Chlamydomonas reinhardtii]|uniref:SET domain-containing protein n=1 Tax=Chlamydomonas reinhardtii TaxID=3055 RepID=A0A2K3CTQ7_CHLRE|nr:uncharacterized protein CHLRE_16g664000v5 [Chlamydomonas reinhardtii]PNW71670.1 hypothetical protein CHLRE_16g664000v5 [Chlamydomonas reinhardtii]
MSCQAVIKYNSKIAQNKSKRKGAGWINIDYDRLYTQPSFNPGRLVGPIKLQPVPGKGRGLVADRELPAAETLLVSEPVGTALAAPEGRELLPHHLVAALENMEAGGRMGAADRARLRLLYDGSAPDSPASARVRGASLDDFRKIDDKLRRAAEAPKKAKGKGFGAPAAAAAPKAAAINTAELGEAPLTGGELERLVAFNSWGNSYSDLGVAALRKERSEAVIGVWPEFALLNHSCAPNTVAFNVGQSLVVQAAAEIEQGQEATTCYLGDLVQTPREQRRAWLKGSYGFDCQCERCRAEAAVPAEVSAAVTAAYELATSEQATKLATEAPGRSDRSSLRPLEGQLAAATDRLEAAMEEAGLLERVRQWLRNSAYAAYFTLAVIRDLPDGSGPGDLGGLFGRTGAAAPFGDPEAPTRLAGMVEAVAPGSDLHLYLTLEALSRTAEAYDREDPRVAEATKSCLRAHILRYGVVSDAVLRSLLEARSRTQHYLGRITLASQSEGAGTALAGSLLKQTAAQAAREMAGTGAE